jgi:hypothetical protein
MPKFKIQDTSVIQVSLPHPVVNGPAIKINPEEDVKVTFTFSGNKVVVPWVLLYDSKHRKSLQLLTITFFHDDFEVLHISHQTTCKYLVCSALCSAVYTNY